MKTLSFVLLVCAPLCAQTVSLNVPAVDSSGASVQTGTAYINWQPFLDNSGHLTPGGSKTVAVANGMLAVSLTASDNAGYVYTVQIQSGSTASVFKWRVPASGASTMDQLGQTLPSKDNTVRLTLLDMLCSTDHAGILRRVKGNSSESLQVCLASGSSFWRSLSSALSNASNQVVRLRAFGDSLTRCWGAAGNTQSSCAGIGPVTQSNLWIEQLRSWLKANYPSHGTGILPLMAGMPSGISNDYYTVSGPTSWYNVGVPTQTGTPGGTFDGKAGLQMGASSSFTTYPQTGDSLVIYYTTYSTVSTAGFTVTIDGQNLGTFGTENTGSDIVAHQVKISAPGGLGSHTATVSCNTTNGACYVYATEWTIGNAGVSVDNLSIGACQAACFGTPGNLQMIDVTGSGGKTFDIIALGTNDYLRGSISDYQNQMSNLIAREQSQGASILVMSMPWTSAGSTNNLSQTLVFQTARTLAQSNGCDYLGLPFTPTFASAAVESSWLEDGIHLNDAGQTAIFNVLLQHLTTATYSWYPVQLGAPSGQ